MQLWWHSWGCRRHLLSNKAITTAVKNQQVAARQEGRQDPSAAALKLVANEAGQWAPLQKHLAMRAPFLPLPFTRAPWTVSLGPTPALAPSPGSCPPRADKAPTQQQQAAQQPSKWPAMAQPAAAVLWRRPPHCRRRSRSSSRRSSRTSTLLK